MPRFTGILLSMLLFMLIYPISMELGVGESFLAGILSLFLLSIVATLRKSRGELWVAVGLLLAEELCKWWSLVSHGSIPDLLVRVLVALFFGYIAYLIVRAVLTEREVTVDTVFGALCAYLIIGFTWASCYGIIELLNPGSFHGVAGVDSQAAQFQGFVYFSLVTLTTLGYGDLVPLTPTAKSFSIVEALLGQIFLAVFVARLIASTMAGARAGAD